MKYTKFISLILVVAMLMLSGVSAFAETAEKPTVKAEHDPSGTTINISGKTLSKNIAGVTLLLLGPDITDVEDDAETPENERDAAVKTIVDNMVADGTWDSSKVASMAQVFAAEDGTYTGSFTLASDATSGDYIVYATSNDVATYEFYFSTPDEKKSSLSEILVAIHNPAFNDPATKAEAIAAVVAKIEEHKRELAFDMTLVKNEDGSDIAQKAAVLSDAAEALFTNEALLAIPQAEGSIQNDDLLTARKEIEVEIVNALFNAEIPSDITAYAGKFLETTTPAALTAYAELTADAKAYAKDLIFGEGFANASDMEAMLADAVKIALIVIDGTKDFTKTASVAGELGLEKASAFGGLTDTQKVNVISNVRVSAPKTVSDLDTYFTNAVNSYSNGAPAPDVDTGEEVDGTTITVGGGNGGGGNDKPATVVYTDLGNYSWAKDAVYSLTEKGILSGYGAGQFAPSNEIKREEFAKVVVAAMFGAEAANNAGAGSFADANSGWYAPFVGYAERAGIIKGVSETEFGVGRSITRQDIMVMLYRAMLLKGFNANTTSSYIADAGEIADYAIEAVNALKNAGIVSGYEDGSIKPTNNATRAEVAIMVDKFLKLF